MKEHKTIFYKKNYLTPQVSYIERERKRQRNGMNKDHRFKFLKP